MVQLVSVLGLVHHACDHPHLSIKVTGKLVILPSRHHLRQEAAGRLHQGGTFLANSCTVRHALDCIHFQTLF